MFKILQEVNDKGLVTNRYTIIAYIHDENSNSNREVWTASNIQEADLASIMQGRKKEQFDMDFGFIVLKSGNGPVIFTTGGELLPVPVKREVRIKEKANGRRRVSNEKSLLQTKKRSGVSH